ncbi:acyl-CoA dehydrogenase family protein [Blastococcus tunisiensis]|uniref:Acyl-CoA dehydrogenase n=1 Tax=Blastococcus tunisiensis TaxID=1798228 RepID=A0A1I2KMW2_9ACTN|nr:acyl-CoA dehydrogenase family protein [Blastococcus sp. DSM 46838]SFF68295.1 Acyl-CoA dehydrogenase [Blastococcus sp. DSM 46838]
MIDLDTYRTNVRAWLRAADMPVVPRDLDKRFAVLREWQRTLFDAGWIGIAWSTESGGQGLTAQHQLVFSEELARAQAPQPIGLIGLDVVGPSIDEYGSEWQRRTLLPRLLSGEDIWCQGFSEPEAGSDLASLRTRARLEGDTFVVSGQKVWTSWAAQADWCALLARSDDGAPKHQGISYLLVDMKTPGITVRPLVQMTGDREFCEVFFDNVRVPADNLVGEIHAGWPIAIHTLGTERGVYTLRRRVDAEVALDDAVAELRQRAALPDGVPLSERFLATLGKATVALRALDAQTRRTVDRLSAGPTPEDSVDKLLLNGIEQTVYGCLADLLGPFRSTPTSRPLGLEAERWVHEHLYSRAASIYGGTSQIQRNIISQRLLGLPRG